MDTAFSALIPVIIAVASKYMLILKCGLDDTPIPSSLASIHLMVVADLLIPEHGAQP